MSNRLKQERIKDLINILNKACEKYYSSIEESNLTNKEYDKLFNELVKLEKETGVIFSCSPTQTVGYVTIEDKIKHEVPILSLQSTKDISDIEKWIDNQEAILSWKIDGVSIILYYDNGLLQKALSRGNGEWGKDITKNVILMRNVPYMIKYKHKLIVRGEGCISLDRFNILKNTKEGERYMNPRNLVAGLVNGTKTTSLLLKQMNFIAHTIEKCNSDLINKITKMEQMLYLEELDFKIVEWELVSIKDVSQVIQKMTSRIDEYQYPVDGLVLAMDDLSFGESLGSTARFPKHSIAFKWEDEIRETFVTGMKWSVSNTGLITPIVQFEPILLDGTTVRQANLHSLKIFKRHKIGIGDKITVYKANKIIPEIDRNLTCSGTCEIPKFCPVCNFETTIIETDKSVKLYCENCKSGKKYIL